MLAVPIGAYRQVSVRSGLVLIPVSLLDVDFAASWTSTSPRELSQPASTELHNSSHHRVIATKLGIVFLNSLSESANWSMVTILANLPQ
jgi:hypothetical protein